MKAIPMSTRFAAKLRRPADVEESEPWAFVVVPKSASDKLPRRGRTSVQGTIDGYPFMAMLEPDGQLSHWLKVPAALLANAGITAGTTVTVEFVPCPEQLEPQLPPELHDLFHGSPEAKATWDATTTIARIDWIHWIESAKQARTRASRLTDACQMLAAGKKRVCCFDPSGSYSKSLSLPREAKDTKEA